MKRDSGGGQEEKHTSTLEIRSLGLSDRWWEVGSGGAMNDSQVLAGAMGKQRYNLSRWRRIKFADGAVESSDFAMWACNSSMTFTQRPQVDSQAFEYEDQGRSRGYKNVFHQHLDGI